jgi:BirA family biotin operon repressor/biotin-[acetyl-CoA-carboxylase] ligase
MTHSRSREEILSVFHHRGTDYVSGEELSQRLGVSRTAIWKQIDQLRRFGYDIEAVPSRGYRLMTSPDTLLAAEVLADLGTRRLGREVLYLPETDSTNLRAFALGEEGAAEGTVVVADTQNSGKGRLGRRWSSPPGVNLYLSLVLRPPIPSLLASQLTFLSAVAVVRAVREVCDLEPSLKWPNDVLLGGRKLAGLLNELSAETERIHFVVLGIGVNLNMTAEQFPDDLRYPGTSLLIEGGRPVSRLAFCRALLHELDDLYDLYLESGFAPILRAWESHFELAGREVEVTSHNDVLRGTVSGLDADGALLVTAADGVVTRILAGDVRPL